MEEECLTLLRELEKKHDVRVLYAVDSGSRSWGWSSAASDFDVRFIYIHNDRRKYISLGGVKKQVIDGEHGKYDFQGWDLAKALTLLQQVNPNMVEWLESPIVYLNTSPELVDRCKELLVRHIRVLPLFHHYRSMAKGHYVEHVAKKSHVKIKKYLSTIRPAAMAEYLMVQYRNKDGSSEEPPKKLVEVDFSLVWQSMKGQVGEEVHAAVMDLISKKQAMTPGGEDSVPTDECLNAWLTGIVNRERSDLLAFESERKEIEREKPPLEEYDELFFNLLGVNFV